MVHTFSVQKPKIASCLHSKPVQSHRKIGIMLFWVVEIFDSCHVSSVHTGNSRNLYIVVKSPERLWWWHFQSWSQNQSKSQAKLNPTRIWIWLLLRKALQCTFFKNPAIWKLLFRLSKHSSKRSKNVQGPFLGVFTAAHTMSMMPIWCLSALSGLTACLWKFYFQFIPYSFNVKGRWGGVTTGIRKPFSRTLLVIIWSFEI